MVAAPGADGGDEPEQLGGEIDAGGGQGGGAPGGLAAGGGGGGQDQAGRPRAAVPGLPAHRLGRPACCQDRQSGTCQVL